jgi:hypothetical protein
MVKFLRRLLLALSLMVFGFYGIGHTSLTDGLIAFYPFNGNANDESGNGNNGVIQGAILTTDRFSLPSQAYYFNGTGGLIILPLDYTHFENNFTIAVWVKFDNFNIDYPYIMHGDNSFIQFHGLGPVYGSMEGQLTFYQQNGSNVSSRFGDFFSNTKLDANKWYFVVITRSNLTFNMYINGIFANQVTDNMAYPISGSYLFLGRGAGQDSYLTGALDSIRIYNRAISDNEIQTLYGQSCFDEGFDAAISTCKIDPASCGINIILTSDLKMHIPNIQYDTISLWADFEYDNTKNDAVYFKVTGAGVN